MWSEWRGDMTWPKKLNLFGTFFGTFPNFFMNFFSTGFNFFWTFLNFFWNFFLELFWHRSPGLYIFAEERNQNPGRCAEVSGQPSTRQPSTRTTIRSNHNLLHFLCKVWLGALQTLWSSLQTLWLSRSYGCPDLMIVQILWLSDTPVCYLSDLMVVQILWLSNTPVCYLSDLMVVQILWLSTSYGCPHLMVVQILWFDLMIVR